MPNFCENKLTVKGEAAEVERFVSEQHARIEYRERPISFTKSVPMPDHIYQGGLTQEERERYGANNWYDWSIENWGTKWDATSTGEWSAPEGSGIAEIYFETAWAPPIPWLITTSTVYPELEFSLRYEEPGMEFAGDITANNGEYEDVEDPNYKPFFDWDEED